MEIEMEGEEGEENTADPGEVELTLTIPSLHDLLAVPDTSLNSLLPNPVLLEECENLCISWEETALKIMDTLPTKPSSFVPLAELELWRERNSRLASTYDQLQSKEVRKVILLLKEARSTHASSFDFMKQEIYWKLQEARDVTRFLSTIERHLRTLTYSMNLNEMTGSLGHVMEGLQMIWMLSRHYNKDERMGALLQMIAKLLHERVTALIHPNVLFLRDPLSALDLSDSAKTLFVTWMTSYMETRTRIEQSGKGARWEFDRTKLFTRTDYAALIAQHLSEIAVVLLEFTNFFGPEIKEVIGDSRKVDDALKNAYMLVKPFTEVEFDPFVVTNGKLWTDLLEQLRKDVRILEAEATSFIDEAFTMVKSAESAFAMLMKFKHIETRDGIHNKLMKKFEDTLMIYIQEVRSVKDFYEKNKATPTLHKYNPPIAGRIWWVRSLFYHIKRTILTFRSQNDVISTEVGQLACEEYLSLAQSMKKYEDSWYETFCALAHKTIPAIRHNILTKVPTGNELGKELDISKGKQVYKVNLPAEVMEMVEESLNLEQMGYRISETVRNIAFQRSHYFRNSRRLEGIVKYYYQVRRNLRPAETLLMEKTITEMERNFEQGVLRLNWTALGIPDYATKLEESTHKFHEVVNQVNKVAKDIRVRLWLMKNSKLYLEPPYKEEIHGKLTIPILDCWDFFKYWERYRMRVYEHLLLQFRGLPPLFLKLETLIYESSTGKRKQFRPYFSGWEKRIFLFMSKFIIRSLYDFEKRLSIPEPLFDVSASLQAPDIHLTPTPHEIYNMVMTGTRECVYGTKNFVRWLRGTCIKTPPIEGGGEKGGFIYSYYLDIGRLPRVLQLMIKIQETVQTLLQRIWNHLKRYRKFKNLWRFNKEKTVSGFAQKNPSVQEYDQKMGFYHDLSTRVDELPSFRLEGAVRINMQPLQSAICRHAAEWISKLGSALATSTRDHSADFERIIKEFERDVFLVPRSVEDLKKVLSTLKAIQEATVEMEGKYEDLRSRYATLTRYHIEFEDEEIHLVDESWKRWQLLWLHEVKQVNKQLEPVKARFAKITIEQRDKFKKEISSFLKRFYAIGHKANVDVRHDVSHGLRQRLLYDLGWHLFLLLGPTPFEGNLEQSFQILPELVAEYRELEKVKTEVTSSEKLLGLPVTLFPEFSELAKDVLGMETLLGEEALQLALRADLEHKEMERRRASELAKVASMQGDPQQIPRPESPPRPRGKKKKGQKTGT